MRKRNRNVAIGTLIAAGIGYAAGLLTAPRSGKDTRKDLQRAALKAKKEAEHTLKKLHTELSDLIIHAKKQGEKLKSSNTIDFEKAIAKAQSAKKRVGEILSAIHEGEAEDKDLQKAINDVHNAIQHLGNYIEKE